VGCVQEPITVVIPQAVELKVHDGCGEGFGERIIDWIRGNDKR
jgi:hypothetical protein